MTNAASPSTIDATEQDIEETLGNARDSAERNITAYRCWVIFGLAVLRVWRVLEGEALFPLVISLVYLGYCVALWAWVRRHGTRPGFALATTVVDLLSAGVFFLQFPRFEHDVHAQLAGQTLFPTLLFAGLLPNFLRYSREVALWTGPVATAVFIGVSVQRTGFHPTQFSAAAVLFVTGFIAASSARRARENLNAFARTRLLRRYVSRLAVESVLADPRAGMSIGGKSVTVTVLAADLRGFTAMSERLPPEEVVRQLNAYHAVMLGELERHGGVLDKFIGDGTLAVFGLGSGSEQDHGATASVACARGMLSALERLNQTRATSGLPPLRMGIGVHTGRVVAGNIGVPGMRLEFTVIGDAVNTAARLETHTKEAGTPALVSAETARRLGEGHGLRALPPLRLRGREQSVDVFALG